jgi:hypothetical protein
MVQRTTGIVKNFVAGGTITAGAIVMFGADDDTVVVGTAATDLLIGVALHAAASGERVDVQMSGIGEVKTGGVIARGGAVTSGAAGVGVALSAAATIKSSIGTALATSASGDVIPVLIGPTWAVTA